MESVIATREEIQRFLSVPSLMADFEAYPVNCFCLGFGYEFGDGFGTGDGAGYSFGFGVGSGNASGVGFSDSSGLGIGDGVGSDDGSGIGYGVGSGFGDGVGSGFGDGAGSGFADGGSGIHALNGNIVDYIDNVPTIIIQIHNNVARGYIINDDLTLQSCYIAKVGSFFAHGKTLKDAIVDAEAKETEKLPIEKRIEKFIEVFGSLDSEHTGKEFYDWHHILTGSCKMGRDEFCKSHNIDLTKKYSVRYFLGITKDSYGGEIIKKISETYEFGKK